jgi:hypothetical protein
MTSSEQAGSVTRRAALAGLGAGGLAVALATAARPAAAQSDMANHPIVGVWNVSTPGGPAMAFWGADGTNIQGVTTVVPGPNGVTYTGAQVGVWEPVDDRTIHFTGVQIHTDANGVVTGSVTIDGHPRVSDDGMTFIDDSPETTVTIRDAANNVLDVITGGPPAMGRRMSVGAPGFPEAAATPTP